MKYITLSRGRRATIDAADHALVSRFRWYFDGRYAHRNPTKAEPERYMHRLIARPPAGKVVDHRNQNRLDNRRSNLRVCTVSQNGFNRGRQANSKTGTKGVLKNPAKDRPWRACIRVNGRGKNLGSFRTKKEARAAYAVAAANLHGEYAGIERARKIRGRRP